MDRSLSQEEINKTKSIDIQTSNYHDDSNSQCFDDENNQDQFENDASLSRKNQNELNLQLNLQLNEQNLNGVNDEGILITAQQEKKVEQIENTNKINNNQITSLKLNQLQNQHNQQNPSPYTISDRKIWAVQGVMPGSVSKKFIRSYKLGRYNKMKSLKIDMEYFNSPHHEQLHLGNNILPFQNNKNRLFTTGSFDYTKYMLPDGQMQQTKMPFQSVQSFSSRVNTGNINKFQNNLKSLKTFRNAFKQQSEDFNQVFSPRTTSQTVIQQVIQQQQNSKQTPQQVNMEIRYIDIITQPIVKQSNFINNKKCPHGMTNMRVNEKKNIFFFNQQSNKNNNPHHIQPIQYLRHQAYSSNQPINQYNQNQYKLDSAYVENSDNMYDLVNKRQYKANNFFGEEQSQGQSSSHQLDGGLHKQNLTFKPKNNLLHSEYKDQQTDHQASQFTSTSNRNFFGRKSEKSMSKMQPNNSLRLPQFATNPENIQFFSKAKQNLVKYVNQIGTQDHPLRNTFVSQKNML
ncbi:hypothetical protein TTHERM_00011720 (macronuclear) [Tetrahymena thermophila SB210]|uniref:Uncharacterized protein n=1 Tax=Tetrahymena thermophila (strain SB210) TaxID=312017 RepID=Q22RW6_TETTS|nr:hypothetical protein TTHERM_00011720 [Tetrahymena thermophila SB210]EAR88006.1 hypothetical protein TTHERM_00011720 [Tetrahymena thermophila SB210]|eukprot:XP_001008251.1 hypothetical protein TTHERM_00011720 [Tetrahymena thermophila SB210]